jgi:hypothetical protein
MIFKNTQLRKKNSFFLCFYDWDRERRLQQRLKLLNIRFLNKVLAGCIKSKVQSAFHELTMTTIQKKIESNKIQEILEPKKQENPAVSSTAHGGEIYSELIKNNLLTIKHLQIVKKGNHIIYEEAKRNFSLHKLEHFLQMKTQREKYQALTKLQDQLTFPIQDYHKIKLYLSILEEEN